MTLTEPDNSPYERAKQGVFTYITTSATPVRAVCVDRVAKLEGLAHAYVDGVIDILCGEYPRVRRVFFKIHS